MPCSWMWASVILQEMHVEEILKMQNMPSNAGIPLSPVSGGWHWEDPLFLLFSGGYYLTSAYGALSLIKNFQEEQAARLLSSETRDTLRQWHKRRTTNRTIPSVDDFQVCSWPPLCFLRPPGMQSWLTQHIPAQRSPLC